MEVSASKPPDAVSGVLFCGFTPEFKHESGNPADHKKTAKNASKTLLFCQVCSGEFFMYTETGKKSAFQGKTGFEG